MEYIVDKRKDVYTILGELATINASDFEVFIPSGSIILENRLNLEFIQESLEKLGKSVSYSTDDDAGMELLNALAGGTLGEYESAQVSADSFENGGFSHGNLFTSLMTRLSQFNFPKIPLPKLKLGFIPIVLGFILLAGAVFGATKIMHSQKAYVKLVVKSEALARSITILVDANLAKEIDSETKSLKGKQISKTFTEEITQEATGTKQKGEKAGGEVVVYNRTESSIKLKKNVILKYKDGDEDLKFKLEEEITIPAESYEDPEDPGSATIPGEASVKVIAEEIGDKYNIKEGKTLEITDYKKSDLVAESSEDFEGGSSETVKIVSSEDIDTALSKVKSVLAEKTLEGLSGSVETGYKFVDGTSSISYVNPEVGAKVNDEAASFVVKQSAAVTGLSYSEKVLEKLIMELLVEYVPESFELSGENIEIGASSLGNSDETVATSSKAALQVTAKTSVLPIINAAELKSKLQDKNITEASRVLGEMRTLSTYEFRLEPNLPFSQKVPKDPERILIEIVEED